MGTKLFNVGDCGKQNDGPHAPPRPSTRGAKGTNNSRNKTNKGIPSKRFLLEGAGLRSALREGVEDLKNVEWLVCSILGDVTALVRDVLGSVLHELCVILEDVAVFVSSLGGVNCLVSAIFHDVTCLLKGILCPKHQTCRPGMVKRMGFCFASHLAVHLK